MIADYILVVIGSLGLIIGTITDFQKREVADWINFGMIVTGISIRLIYSIIFKDVWFILFGLIWLGIAWLFGLLMYYTGQWGGGDCKMIMGLGALFGTNPFFFNQTGDIISWIIPYNLQYNVSFFAHFLFNSFFIGSIYGLIWTFFLLVRNWKECRKKSIEILKNKYMKFAIIGSSLFFIAGYIFLFYIQIFDWVLQGLLFMILIFPYLLLFVKTIEGAGMIRMMKIEDLTEGEWIVDDVIVDGKRISGPKDLGITYSQIQKLKKLKKAGKIHEVKVKIGIPFVPAFLMAFVITSIFGNILFAFI